MPPSASCRSHRRRFEEIRSGPVAGPATALAWTNKYFLLGFARSSVARSVLSLIAHLSSFWLKYLDLWLGRKAEAFDAAPGYYFLGRKSRHELSPPELMKAYCGKIVLSDS